MSTSSSDIPISVWEAVLSHQDPQTLVKILLALGRDNVRLRQENEQLKSIAETDALTGLHNLHYWNTHAPRIWNHYSNFTPANENNRRNTHDLVLAFIDVNGLGAINKEYGDRVGDALIKCAAESLTSCFKRATDLRSQHDDPDYLIVRKGGDELLMLLPQTSVSFLENEMMKINDHQAFECNGQLFKLQCSLGYAVKAVGKTLETACDEADFNMRQRKITAPKSRLLQQQEPKVA